MNVAFDSNAQTHFQNYVFGQTWVQPTALNLMVQNGLYKTVGVGAKKITTPKWRKMEPGMISVGTETIHEQAPGYDTTTTTLIDATTKVVLKVDDVEIAMNSDIGLHATPLDMVAEALNQAMKPFRQWVDGFIYWGSTLSTGATHDDWVGDTGWTGLMNGFTSVGAGPFSAKDDNVSAAYDYIETVASYIRTLETAGFNTSQPIYFLSNEVVKHDMRTGNHKIATYDFTNEYKAIFKNEGGKRIIEENVIPIFSPNNKNNSSHNTICMFVPRTSEGEITCRLVIGRNFKLYPQHNGGLNGNNCYEWIIGWSGAVEIIHATAGCYSGNLTT